MIYRTPIPGRAGVDIVTFVANDGCTNVPAFDYAECKPLWTRDGGILMHGGLANRDHMLTRWPNADGIGDTDMTVVKFVATMPSGPSLSQNGRFVCIGNGERVASFAVETPNERPSHDVRPSIGWGAKGLLEGRTVANDGYEPSETSTNVPSDVLTPKPAPGTTGTGSTNGTSSPKNARTRSCSSVRIHVSYDARMSDAS